MNSTKDAGDETQLAKEAKSGNMSSVPPDNVSAAGRSDEDDVVIEGSYGGPYMVERIVGIYMGKVKDSHLFSSLLLCNCSHSNFFVTLKVYGLGES